MFYLEDLKENEQIAGIEKILFLPPILDENILMMPNTVNPMLRVEDNAYRLLCLFYGAKYNKKGIVDFGANIDDFAKKIFALSYRDFKKPLQELIINGFIELYKDDNYDKDDLSTYKFKVFFPITAPDPKDILKPTTVSTIAVKDTEYEIENLDVLEEAKVTLDYVKDRIVKMLEVYELLDKYDFSDIMLNGLKNINLESLGEVEYRFNKEYATILDKNIWIIYEDIYNVSNIKEIFPEIFCEIEGEVENLIITFENEIWDGISKPKFILE